MSRITEAIKRHRRALESQEQAAASRMIEAYGNAWGRIEQELAKVTQKIAAAQAMGTPITPFWLYQQEQYREMLVIVWRELDKFAQMAAPEIVRAQQAAIQAGITNADELIRAGIGDGPLNYIFGRPSIDAIETLVGGLGPGSPVYDLLATFPQAAQAGVAQTLTEGVILGFNPRQIAREIKDYLGGNLARALTISRTETLRAYREASRRAYQANSDVVKGWIWHCSLGTACAVCTFMHGTKHKLDEPMASHPNCRCSPVPLTFTWAELGFSGVKETGANIERGLDWFQRQAPGLQRSILGAAFDPWQQGEIALTNLIGRRKSAEWGAMYYTRSVKMARTGAQFKGPPSVSL